MIKFRRLNITISLCLIFSLSCPIHAGQQEQQADIVIKQIYLLLSQKPNTSMAGRLELVSQQLLNYPYVLGALGEGDEGNYDKRPLYRVDAFDCETYVDTVVAIALSRDLNGFKRCIRTIRYQAGQVDFVRRNHFASLDWNGNNQQQGLVRDITPTIKNKAHQPIAQFAKAWINKPAWYEHLPMTRIYLPNAPMSTQEQKLKELRGLGKALQRSLATIPYIPLTALFDAEGQANDSLFQQIPNGAIIEIVRPNWDLRKEIGTCLNVSHLGFAFWHQGRLYFRQASLLEKKTSDTPLIEYLRNALKSPTIRGINIQMLVPTTPGPPPCDEKPSHG